MYEFLAGHELYIVLVIVLICWIGIFSYLYRLDKRIKFLEESKRQKE